MKRKESLKIDLEHTRELKKQQQTKEQNEIKLWNMKVTVILIVVCKFRTVLKGLEKRMEKLEIKGRIETI